MPDDGSPEAPQPAASEPPLSSSTPGDPHPLDLLLFSPHQQPRASQLLSPTHLSLPSSSGSQDPARSIGPQSELGFADGEVEQQEQEAQEGWGEAPREHDAFSLSSGARSPPAYEDSRMEAQLAELQRRTLQQQLQSTLGLRGHPLAGSAPLDQQQQRRSLRRSVDRRSILSQGSGKRSDESTSRFDEMLRDAERRGAEGIERSPYTPRSCNSRDPGAYQQEDLRMYPGTEQTRDQPRQQRPDAPEDHTHTAPPARPSGRRRVKSVTHAVPAPPIESVEPQGVSPVDRDSTAGAQPEVSAFITTPRLPYQESEVSASPAHSPPGPHANTTSPPEGRGRGRRSDPGRHRSDEAPNPGDLRAPATFKPSVARSRRPQVAPSNTTVHLSSSFGSAMRALGGPLTSSSEALSGAVGYDSGNGNGLEVSGSVTPPESNRAAFGDMSYGSSMGSLTGSSSPAQPMQQLQPQGLGVLPHFGQPQPVSAGHDGRSGHEGDFAADAPAEPSIQDSYPTIPSEANVAASPYPNRHLQFSSSSEGLETSQPQTQDVEYGHFQGISEETDVSFLSHATNGTSSSMSSMARKHADTAQAAIMQASLLANVAPLAGRRLERAVSAPPLDSEDAEAAVRYSYPGGEELQERGLWMGGVPMDREHGASRSANRHSTSSTPRRKGAPALACDRRKADGEEGHSLAFTGDEVERMTATARSPGKVGAWAKAAVANGGTYTKSPEEIPEESFADHAADSQLQHLEDSEVRALEDSELQEGGSFVREEGLEPWHLHGSSFGRAPERDVQVTEADDKSRLGASQTAEEDWLSEQATADNGLASAQSMESLGASEENPRTESQEAKGVHSREEVQLRYARESLRRALLERTPRDLTASTTTEAESDLGLSPIREERTLELAAELAAATGQSPASSRNGRPLPFRVGKFVATPSGLSGTRSAAAPTVISSESVGSEVRPPCQTPESVQTLKSTPSPIKAAMKRPSRPAAKPQASVPAPVPPPISLPCNTRKHPPRDALAREDITEWESRTGVSDRYSLPLHQLGRIPPNGLPNTTVKRLVGTGGEERRGVKDRWGNVWSLESHLLSPLTERTEDRSVTTATSCVSLSTRPSNLSLAGPAPIGNEPRSSMRSVTSNNSLAQRLNAADLNSLRMSRERSMPSYPGEDDDEEPHERDTPEARAARKAARRERRERRERRRREDAERAETLAERQERRRQEKARKEKFLTDKQQLLNMLHQKPGDPAIIRRLGALYLYSNGGVAGLKLAVRHLEASLQIVDSDAECWRMLGHAWAALLETPSNDTYQPTEADRAQQAHNATIGFRKAIVNSSYETAVQCKVDWAQYLEKRSRLVDSLNVLQECCQNEGVHDPLAHTGHGDLLYRLSRSPTLDLPPHERVRLAYKAADELHIATEFLDDGDEAKERGRRYLLEAEAMAQHLGVQNVHRGYRSLMDMPPRTPASETGTGSEGHPRAPSRTESDNGTLQLLIRLTSQREQPGRLAPPAPPTDGEETPTTAEGQIFASAILEPERSSDATASERDDDVTAERPQESTDQGEYSEAGDPTPQARHLSPPPTPRALGIKEEALEDSLFATSSIPMLPPPEPAALPRPMSRASTRSPASEPPSPPAQATLPTLPTPVSSAENLHTLNQVLNIRSPSPPPGELHNMMPTPQQARFSPIMAAEAARGSEHEETYEPMDQPTAAPPFNASPSRSRENTFSSHGGSDVPSADPLSLLLELDHTYRARATEMRRRLIELEEEHERERAEMLARLQRSRSSSLDPSPPISAHRPQAAPANVPLRHRGIESPAPSYSSTAPTFAHLRNPGPGGASAAQRLVDITRPGSAPIHPLQGRPSQATMVGNGGAGSVDPPPQQVRGRMLNASSPAHSAEVALQGIMAILRLAQPHAGF